MTTERLRLSSVAWKDYLRFLSLFEEHPAYQITYDRGELEIISRRFADERDRECLSSLIHTITEVCKLEIISGGSTTLRLKRRRRGIDPDRCFWIANVAKMAGKRSLNLRTDPPPDLVVEVNPKRSWLNRLRILARLGVPEIWQLHETTLTFFRLADDGTLAECANSGLCASFTAANLIPFIQQHREGPDDNEVTRAFRAWLLQRTPST